MYIKKSNNFFKRNFTFSLFYGSRVLDTSNLIMAIYNNINIRIEEKGVWIWDGML
jgi:hypothetical protein